MPTLAELKKEQAAILEWVNFDGWHKPFAVTLTMRKRITSRNGKYVTLDEYLARQNLRHFLNRLNLKIFGYAFKRNPKANRVAVFPVLEGDAEKRLHFHLTIDCPREELVEDFANLVAEAWRGTDWAYRQIQVVPGDHGWVSEAQVQGGL